MTKNQVKIVLIGGAILFLLFVGLIVLLKTGRTEGLVPAVVGTGLAVAAARGRTQSQVEAAQEDVSAAEKAASETGVALSDVDSALAQAKSAVTHAGSGVSSLSPEEKLRQLAALHGDDDEAA